MEKAMLRTQLSSFKVKEMGHQVTVGDSDSSRKWWDYRELLNTHSIRRRFICVAGLACFDQISGISLTS
ncbi:hypothetical protein PENSUB_6715 [Penicillium subrubescens]|jgi:hypothetical protein|uniref:Uncharacterized protein n=1 Tax=Penicillium subrubescens TaxID=1316194 RepID=A0A1Q5TXN2_9EURO|nr:hypothetical protein PENSUB_6715 [Penicillium subrubescens]